MRNARLDEAQAGIKVAWRNTNKLLHAGDTTIMVKREEKLKSHLMKVKEESEKACLKQFPCMSFVVFTLLLLMFYLCL